MTLRHSLCTLALAALAVPGVAPAQTATQATLRWKFSEGQKLPYVMTQETKTKLNVQGNQINTTMTQVIDMTWDVKKVNADGSALMTQTIDRMKMSMDGPAGNKFEYDSKEGGEPAGPLAAVAKMIKGVTGVPIELTMSPRGEVTDVKIPDKMIESLKVQGPNGQAVGGMFTEEGFKNMASQGSIVFPAEALTPGKTWTATKSVDAAVIGKMIIDTTYKYVGAAKGEGEAPGLQQIDADLSVKIQPAENAQVQVGIESQDNAAKFLFDTTKGVLSSSEVRQSMKMGLSAMGQKFVQDVTSTVSMKLASGATR